MVDEMIAAADRKVAELEAKVILLEGEIEASIQAKQISPKGDHWHNLHAARIRLETARAVRAALGEVAP